MTSGSTKINTSLSSSRLYYYGARYYDPKSAVFLGVDPLSDKYPGWSPFAYTLNNPVRLTDPDGRDPGEPDDPPKSKTETPTIKDGLIYSKGKIDEGSYSLPGPEILGNGGAPESQGGHETISFCELAPEQDFSGFWGGVKYFWSGGNVDGYHYNMDGKATGLAPIMGMPPSFIGGPLRKGEQALKLGKYLFNPAAFHAVKKGVLSFANPKSFSHIVGTNPDLMFKGGKIWLTGTKTGGYYGRSYETGMTIADFLKLF